MLYGIIIGFIIIFLLIIIFLFSNNKYQLIIIKIDKAEEDIGLYLDKKKELLERCRTIILKELKHENVLEGLDRNILGLSHFEIHDHLKILYNELFKIIDEHEKLLKSDSLLAILDELNTNEENIIGAIKFYNDNVVEFNQLVVAFPTKVVALFKRYKKKEFYSNEKREIFDIMRDR